MTDLAALRKAIAATGCECDAAEGEPHACLAGLAEDAANELQRKTRLLGSAMEILGLTHPRLSAHGLMLRSRHGTGDVLFEFPMDAYGAWQDIAELLKERQAR